VGGAGVDSTSQFCARRPTEPSQHEGEAMVRAMLFAVAVAAGAWMTGAAADEKPAAKGKEVKLTGTMVCASCALNESKKCANVLQVKEGAKTVNYYLADKGNGEAYHDGVCGGGKVEGVTVTGTVAEKDGKKTITPSKVDLKK
jgi:hypothetical protein